MAGKAKARRKKISVRAAKPAPVTRKRRVGRSAKTEDPVLTLREHREKLEDLFKEARELQEATFQGIGRLMETAVAQARSVSAQLADEIEELDKHCRKLKERDGESCAV
jgi:seryl-tRNA synthetase